MSFQQRLIISPFLIPVPRAIATIRNKSFEPLSSQALRSLFCSISSKTLLRPCDCLGFSILRTGFSLTHSHSLTAFEKTWDFDELVHNEIEKKQPYQDYLANKNNFPTIWLNTSTAELFFSAVTQGASLYELLKRIAFSRPSKVIYEIEKFMTELDLKPSLAPLFAMI